MTEQGKGPMTTAEVAKQLGLTVLQVIYRAHRDGVAVTKHANRYFWTAEAVEELRAAEKRRQAAREAAEVLPGLSAHQAAQKLGLQYPQLLRFIQDHKLPIPRVGPFHHFVFDDEAFALVRAALRRQQKAPPPPSGFTTRQVATALGVPLKILVKVMTPLRKTLPLHKKGAYLIWSAEAVAIVREAFARRHQEHWIEEAEDL